MSAPTRKKARRTSGCQPAAAESEVFLLYEGGEVADELKRTLTRVRFGPRVTKIPDGAFSRCEKLVEVELNEGLKAIGESAFAGCRALRSVAFPSSVTELWFNAFHGCIGLVELRLNEGLELIDAHAFQGCTSLRSVTVPTTVTVLNDSAFGGCSGLAEVRLPHSLEIIGEYTFHDCSALRSVTIPSPVTELGWRSFMNCENLSEVIFADGKRLLNQDFFNCGFRRGDQGLLNEKAINEMLFEEPHDGRHGGFAFGGCRLSFVKISISWEVYERLNRLRRECLMSVFQKIQNSRHLELRQDGYIIAILARFPVVDSADADDSEDEDEDDIFEVRDDNLETARSMYQVVQLIAFHELKEASIAIELAMWKSRLDGVTSIPRSDCRVAIPGPAKSLIMEYGGFAGFLEAA